MYLLQYRYSAVVKSENKTVRFNPYRTPVSYMIQHMAGRRRLLLLTTCSDDSKPYMILKALDESYKSHIGFAIIQARGEEQ